VDLAISKTDGQDAVLAGSAITYTVVVTNNGSAAVADVVVSDVMPASLIGATWTCVAAPGSSCASSSGAGHINSTVTLSGGGRATFTVRGMVPASAQGILANTASVTLPAGFTDPAPGNNTATDTTVISLIPVTGLRPLYLPLVMRGAP